MARTSDGLTPQQHCFVNEYLVDLNASKAAIRAGYASANADVTGPRLLGIVGIAAAIEDALDARARRTGITADRVLREYARVAFADMRRYVKVSDAGVEMKPSEEWDDDTAAAVAEVAQVTTKDGGTLKFKLHDKLGALDALGRHLGLDAAKKVDIEVKVRQMAEEMGLNGDEAVREAERVMKALR